MAVQCPQCGLVVTAASEVREDIGFNGKQYIHGTCVDALDWPVHMEEVNDTEVEISGGRSC